MAKGKKAPGKRASGGARAVAKKKRERAAARKRAAAGGQPTWLEKVKKLGPPPKKHADAHSWLGKAALLVVLDTMSDTALPPEQMRRDAMKQIEQASKVLDPAKLSEELAELYDAFKELQASVGGGEQEQHHAGDDETSEAGGSPPGTPIV